jgi:hypothetical protein
MRLFGPCPWIANIQYADGTIGDYVVVARSSRSAANIVACLMERNGRICEIYPLTARESWILLQNAAPPITARHKPV